MKKIVATCAALMALMIGIAYAHSGNTDANGGHYDRSTGEYHYHHGYPAHSHAGGKCPYNFKDKTGQNSGGQSTGTGTKKATGSQNKKVKTIGDSLSPGVIAAGAGVLAVIIGWNAWNNHKYRQERQREFEERERLRKIELARKAAAEEAAERERQRKEEEAINAEKRFYMESDLNVIANVPDKYFIGQHGFPEEKEKGDEYIYGKSLDVYVSNWGRGGCYHRKGCRYAKIISNSYDRRHADYNKRACSICNPSPLPDTEWYKEYRKHSIRKKELGL